MRYKATFLLACVLLMASGGRLPAQVTLGVDLINTTTFPTVSMQVTARQNGIIYRGLDATTVRIWEDGIEQKPVTVVCATGTKDMEIVFLIGSGSGMSVTDVEAAKGIALNIIGKFNGQDFGGVCTYSSNPPSTPMMVQDVSTMQNAVNIITASNNQNYLYDAILISVGEITSNGAIVFLGTEADNGSTADRQTAINAIANRGCKFFYYPMGGGAAAQWLTDLANSSGGFVSTAYPNPEDQIENVLRGTPDYCMVSYESSNLCRDGIARNLNVQVRINSDSSQQAASFPLDANNNTIVTPTWKLEDVTGTSGKSKRVNVLQQTNITKRYLYDGYIEINFDKSLLKIDSAGAFGALAAGMAFTVSETATGAKINFTGVAPINGTGTLFYFYATPSDVASETNVPVTFAGTTISRGCLNVTRTNGSVRILPKSAKIEFTASPSLQFDWDAVNKKYNPEIAELLVGIKNTGDLDVTDLTAIVSLPINLHLAAFTSETLPMSPSTLKPGETAIVKWFVKPVPQATVTSGQFLVHFTSHEGASTQQQIAYNITAAEQGVKFSAYVEQVAIQQGSHTPKPSNVHASIAGVGVIGGKAGNVEIKLPTGLTLVTGSISQSFPALANGSSQELAWAVNYPVEANDRTYSIDLYLSGTELAPDTIHLSLFVPGLAQPEAYVSCSTQTDTLRFNKTAKKYLPDPMQYTIVVKNSGLAAIDSVAAILSLDEGLSAQEPLSRMVAMQIVPGDSISATWLLSYSGGFCTDIEKTIDVEVRYPGSEAMHCVRKLLILGVENEPPVITAKTPDPFDKAAQNVQQTFSVTANDPEGGPLTYEWFIGGVKQAETSNSFTTTFAQLGQASVSVTIHDVCDSSTQTTWVFDVVLDVETTPASAYGFTLLGNYPNPFNPSTVIEYRLPDGEHRIRLDLLNSNGTLVRTLTDERLLGGLHRYELNAAGLPSGTFYVKLQSGAVVVTRPLTLVK